ncbi:DUF3313 family protein [Thalassotalea euphylliae]|uniref:DUF3313 family protein n=1 Tax=Thalassotalea euphylliae TaxID=1655234 RepID=UPI00362E0307
MKNAAKLLVLPMLLGSLVIASTTALAKDASGMVQQKKSGSEMIYAVPETNFSKYDSVVFLPSEISFKKNWQRSINRNASSINSRVTDEKMDIMKKDMAALFEETFKEEFANKGYNVVNQLSPTTLVIRPAIADLDIAVPIVKSSFMSEQKIRYAGSATIYLEIFDGMTKKPIARVAENRFLGEGASFNRASATQNRADAKYTLKSWAETLTSFLKETKQSS